MDRQEAAEEFLNSLIRTLNKASFYANDHPAFLKAVDDFRNTVDSTHRFIDPIVIGTTINSIFVDQREFSGQHYEDLAKRLHQRRIKIMQIRKGTTLEELSLFLNKISAPLKDIIKSGGIAHILNKENMPHLSIEELDYSELLKTDTGEYKDIWVYLLGDALEKQDHSKVIQLSDIFEKMTRYYTIKELLENDELRETLQKFFNYIKDRDKERFSQCSLKIAEHIFVIKDDAFQVELEKMRALFNSFTESDFAEMLTNEVLNVDAFDSSGLDLFSKITSAEIHPAIASLTAKSLNQRVLGDKQKIRNKIESLLRDSDKSSCSQVYLDTLSSFLKSISGARGFSFDHDLAYANYRLILLDLLLRWQSKDRLEAIIEEASKILKNKDQGVDVTYIKLLADIIKKKKTEAPQMSLLLDGLDKQITHFVENNIWDEEPSADFQYLSDYLESSTLGVDLYLNRIFDENKVNAAVLKLFLKFFPDSLHLFNMNLKKRISDIDFISNLIKSLKAVDSPLGLNILEQIYLFSENYIKIEVLRAMQDMGAFDKEFLLSILQKDNAFLKKEALLALMKDEKAKGQALEVLFSTKGSRRTVNRALLENIILVEEMGLKEAKDYLKAVSKNLFFWNWGIKRRIREILSKWK
ncbi:hypothetical protein ACFL1D_00595 [Candidatus Omnitrophota bacterium]